MQVCIPTLGQQPTVFSFEHSRSNKGPDLIAAYYSTSSPAGAGPWTPLGAPTAVGADWVPYTSTVLSGVEAASNNADLCIKIVHVKDATGNYTGGGVGVYTGAGNVRLDGITLMVADASPSVTASFGASSSTTPSGSASPSGTASSTPTVDGRVAAITPGSATFNHRDVVNFTVTAPAPSADDVLALFLGPFTSLDLASAAPAKMVRLSGVGSWSATGTATVSLRLPALAGAAYTPVLLRGTLVDWTTWSADSAALQVLVVGPTVAPTAAAARAPVLLRLLPGGDGGPGRRAVTIAWNAPAGATAPQVRWGTSPDALTNTLAAAAASRPLTRSDMCGDASAQVSLARSYGWAELGATYTALLPLADAATLFYVVGDAGDGGAWSSPPTRLNVPPAPGSVPAPGAPALVSVVADVGAQTDDDGVTYRDAGTASRAVAAGLAADAAAGSTSLIFMGDVGYADGMLYQWAAVLDMLQGAIASAQLVPSMGNHESAWPSDGGVTGSSAYWADPINSYGECGVVAAALLLPRPGEDAAVTAAAPWFWLAQGLITNIALSTEHDFTPGSAQHNWLSALLPRINRAVTPFVVVQCHRPFYTTSGNTGTPDAHIEVSQALRAALGPLLNQWRVTLVLTAHVHNYQRNCVSNEAADGCLLSSAPVDLPPASLQLTPVPPTTARLYDMPPGPVHVGFGHGGIKQNTKGLVTPWNEETIVAYGWGRLW